MANIEPYFVGPMRCRVTIVPHKDFVLKWRKNDEKTDDWNPTRNYWGDPADWKKQKAGGIVEGRIQHNGSAVIQMSSSKSVHLAFLLTLYFQDAGC